MRAPIIALCVGLGLAGQAAAAPAARAAEGAAKAEQTPLFATVGDAVVTLREYRLALREGIRRKFYHGKVPERELAAFQREVGARLVTRLLLLQEARRRGITPEEAWVKRRLERFIERNRRHPEWPQRGARLVEEMTQRLQDESRLRRLEQSVRAVQAPSERQIRDYYESHREKFREPERLRLSIILLKVAPWSPPALWEAARVEARRLVARLRAGAEFAALARLHSGDATAERGGDMGYVHRGMLSEDAQKAVDALSPGDVAAPLDVLEGVAIFRLVERQPVRQSPFAAARERARELWLRERRERSWQALIQALREATAIEVHEEHFLPLEEAAAKGT